MKSIRNSHEDLFNLILPNMQINSYKCCLYVMHISSILIIYQVQFIGYEVVTYQLTFLSDLETFEPGIIRALITLALIFPIR